MRLPDSSVSFFSIFFYKCDGHESQVNWEFYQVYNSKKQVQFNILKIQTSIFWPHGTLVSSERTLWANWTCQATREGNTMGQATPASSGSFFPTVFLIGLAVFFILNSDFSNFLFLKTPCLKSVQCNVSFRFTVLAVLNRSCQCLVLWQGYICRPAVARSVFALRLILRRCGSLSHWSVVLV